MTQTSNTGKSALDLIPQEQEEVVQRYEAGEPIGSIVAYLRELGLPANWYWVDSTLDRHQVVRHAKPGEIPKGGPQGFSANSAAVLRRETPWDYLPCRRRPATEHTRRTFGDPSSHPAEPTLSKSRLEKLALRHAGGKGQPIEALATNAGMKPAALREALRRAGHVVSTYSEWLERELERLAGDIVRMYRDEKKSVSSIADILQNEHEVIVSPERVRTLLKRHMRKVEDLSLYELHQLARSHDGGHGEPIGDLARSAGIHPADLTEGLRSAGYIVSTRARWTSRQLEKMAGEIVRRYVDDNYSTEMLVTFLQGRDVIVSSARVRTLLKSRGVTLRRGQVIRRERPKRKEARTMKDYVMSQIAGSEEKLARRILDGGETVQGIAAELGMDHILLSAALKETGHLPNMNLSRYRAQLRKSR